MTAIFLSDLHLGNMHCQALALNDFLDRTDKDHLLYLVGDIFDDMLRQWPTSHLSVLEKLLLFRGIAYIPGNHDVGMRLLAGLSFDKFRIMGAAYYTAGDGRRYMVVHGDQYDPSMIFGNGPRWLRNLTFRTKCDPHSYIAPVLERKVSAVARRSGFDGVICGHSHMPADKHIADVHYVNCGDWLWHNTAAIDDGHGLKLLRYGAVDDDRKQEIISVAAA